VRKTPKLRNFFRLFSRCLQMQTVGIEWPWQANYRQL